MPKKSESKNNKSNGTQAHYRALDRRSKRKIAYTFVFLVVLTTAVFVTTTPRPRDDFFQLYVLGNKGLAANYFPGSSLGNISVGAQDNWTLNVINKFSSVQLVQVLVKLGNISSSFPISNQSRPADLPVVTSFLGTLEPNETWQIPFQWRVSSFTTNSNLYYLSLKINNEAYAASVPAINGEDFRFIFELWSASAPSTNSLHFGWNDNGEMEAAWLQIYFNVTSTITS